MQRQLTADGRLRHLVGIEGLPRAVLDALLARAAQWAARPHDASDALRHVGVATLFFEPSTRTRPSFQRAAQRLGASRVVWPIASTTSTCGEKRATATPVKSLTES